jgi:hypothetical protein
MVSINWLIRTLTYFNLVINYYAFPFRFYTKPDSKIILFEKFWILEKSYDQKLVYVGQNFDDFKKLWN